MADKLDGLVAFVTGGASGLGLAHARLLAERGAKVAISDLTQAAIARARSELKRAGHDILAVKADAGFNFQVRHRVERRRPRWVF